MACGGVGPDAAGTLLSVASPPGVAGVNWLNFARTRLSRALTPHYYIFFPAFLIYSHGQLVVLWGGGAGPDITCVDKDNL